VPAGVEAENDFGAWRMFEADTLWANRHTAIGAELESGSLAPNIRPTGAARGWADHGAVLVFGQVPGTLWGLAQFAMGFMAVAVVA